MDKKRIAGAGGGGQNQQQTVTQASAFVAPDNLDSRQVVRIIDLVSEGEIEGFPSAAGYTPGTEAYNNAILKDIYFDNTPVLRAGADPSNAQTSDFNFDLSNAAIDFRSGTQTQTYLSSIADSSQRTTAVNLKVEQAIPVTRSITDANVTSVRVTVGTPILQKVESNGDINGISVIYQIQASFAGGPYQTLVQAQFSGRTPDLYKRVHRLDLTQAPPVDIRVVRVSADAPAPGSTVEYSDIFWYDYTEKISGRTRFPNSALVGLRLSAEQFSSIPVRSYRLRGVKVRIPDNATVDSTNGRLTYSGSWGGTFGAAQWTTDPAWILWDLLTSSRYGLGDHVDEDQLDKWSFLAASQYSAELVPDGKGGEEPRFACNVVIQAQQEAFSLINDLCSVFRAMPFWSAGTLEVSQDRPQDYSYIFNQTNVTEAGFSYSGSGLKTRHTVAVVKYFDMNLRNIAYEVIEDKTGIDKFGVVKTEVEAFACTSQGQARRVGEWLLYSEQNETEIVSFETDIAAGITVRPGDLIKIGDPVRAGVSRSGRCAEGSTVSQVNLDRTDTTIYPSGAPTNFWFNVILPDGSLQNISGSNLVGNVVFLGSSLPQAPSVGAPWTIGTAEISMSTWRVLSVAENEDTFGVTAVAYNSSKYNYIERDVPLSTRDVSDLGEPPEPVTNLNATEILYESNGQVLAKLIVSWQGSERALKYEVRYRVNNGNWVDRTVRTIDLEIQNSDVGIYEIEVTAIGILQNKRSSAASLTFNALGKTAPPETIPDLFIAPIDEHTAELYWPQSVDIDVRIGGKVRIRHTPITDGTATWGKSNDIVPAVNGSSTRKIVPLLEGTYFIRAVDSLGNESAGTASVVVDLPEPQDLLLVQEYREEDNSPPFNGTGTDLYYNSAELGLSLASDTLVDDMATDGDWDALGLIDYIGGAVSEGTYEFYETLDLGAKYDLGIQRILKTRAYEPGNTWDERLGNIDLWDDIDGDDLGAANCNVYIRSTNDDPAGTPTWKDWQPFVNNTARGRGFQFKVVATSIDPAQNVVIEELGVTTHFERRTEQQRNINSGTSAYTVTFPTAFYAEPSIGITAQDMDTGDYFQLSSVSRTGFTVTFRDSGGSIVSKTFDYQAVGHGREIT